MTGVAIVTRRRRLPGRHGPTVDALLIQLEGLGDRDLPLLDQGPVRVAARTRLCHLGPAGGRPGILLRQQLMGRSVTILALGGLLHALRHRFPVHARLPSLHHRLVARLAGRRAELRGRLHDMGAMAALAVELRAALAAVDALGKLAAGRSVAGGARHRRNLLGVGDLLDARVAGGAGQAPVDGGLEGGLVAVEGDFLPLTSLTSPWSAWQPRQSSLVGPTGAAATPARPGRERPLPPPAGSPGFSSSPHTPSPGNVPGPCASDRLDMVRRAPDPPPRRPERETGRTVPLPPGVRQIESWDRNGNGERCSLFAPWRRGSGPRWNYLRSCYVTVQCWEFATALSFPKFSGQLFFDNGSALQVRAEPRLNHPREGRGRLVRRAAGPDDTGAMENLGTAPRAAVWSQRYAAVGASVPSVR